MKPRAFNPVTAFLSSVEICFLCFLSASQEKESVSYLLSNNSISEKEKLGLPKANLYQSELVMK
jgi:hypothetical protein